MPASINYREIKELSNEAKEKLEKIRPVSLGQASRISGVSPADVSILMIHKSELQRFKTVSAFFISDYFFTI